MDEQEIQMIDESTTTFEVSPSEQDAASTYSIETGIINADEASAAPDFNLKRALRNFRPADDTSGHLATETELEPLLTEVPQQTFPQSGRVVGGSSRSNEEYETWVEVELILKVRRTSPFPGVVMHQSWGDRVKQYAHFVKFRDQSYWHCSWIPGSTILQMHPAMAKSYQRRNADLINLADEEYKENMNLENEASFNALPKIPSSDDDDEESTVENVWIGTDPTVLNPFPKCGRRRYEFYLKSGVPPKYLYPERVLSVSEGFKPTSFVPIRRKWGASLKTIKKSTLSSMTRLREILVKWYDLDEANATWETVEIDLIHLDTMLSRYRRAGLQPLDPCGRRLLPSFVRRMILQLANAHLSQVASLYTLHLGEASRERIVQHYQNSPRRSVPPPPCNWQKNWTGKQPAYLSEWEGGKLHAYQLEGVRWLRKSFYDRVNTILADEMGLGKTVQVIAMLYSLVKEDSIPGPFLVVVPLAVTMNWKREFAFWAPEMQVIVYVGDRRNRAMINEYCLYVNKASCIPAFHVMITSFEMISFDRTNLMGFFWQILVVDEAHRLKNKQARLFRDLLSYDVQFKILLTGTPLQNNLDELIHLLHFMDPDKFSDVQALSDRWTSMTKEERAENLQTKLKGHLLRRMKRDVVKDLPRKTEVIVPLSLTPLQRYIYKMVLTKNYEALRMRNLMNSLQHLQKVCNHPYLMPSGEALAARIPAPAASGTSLSNVTVYEPNMLVEASAKLHLLMRMLRRLRDRGHRVLIFSHLVSMLDLIQIALYNDGFDFERLDGKVRGPLRQSAIDRFNSQDAAPFVFLLSTRAGGEGINLASADTVILFDSDWNPHRDLQALARAHRIGQSKHVLIYRLIMQDTVEERIIHVAQSKLALTKIMDEDWAAEAMETPSTSAKNKEKDRNHQHFSRSEAHNILKTGVENLFAVEDDDYTKKGHFENNRGLMQTTNCTPNLEAREGTLIYDDENLERLLDRDALSTFKSSSDSSCDCVVDELDSAPIVFSPSSENNAYSSKQFLSATAESPVDGKEITDFWEKLLKKRYERMLTQEVQDMEKSGVVSGFESRSAVEDSIIITEVSDDCESRSHPPIEGVTECSAARNTPDNPGIDDDANDTVEIVNWAPGTVSLLCSTSQTTTKPEAPQPTGKAAGIMGRRRRSTRRVRPTALSLSAYHFITRAEDEYDDDDGVFSGNPRFQRSNRRNRRTGLVAAADSDEEFRPDSSMSSSSTDGGRSTNDVREVSINNRAARDVPESQSKTKKKDHTSRAGEEEFFRSPPGEDESQMADMYRQIDWQNDTTAMCSPLRDLLGELSADVRFEENKMIIYGFTPHERQLFLESVMRYGLPPKGTLPLPEWLPFTLRSKPPEELFAYTNLFMRHLYSDPKVLDAEALEWSDGVPTEGVSGVAVLSRIAMMALIRAKAIQFEDCNIVPNKFKQVKDSTFRFEIYDGGLTLLSSLWRHDMEQLSARFERLRSSVQTAMKSTNSESEPKDALELTNTSIRNRALSVILRKWHKRHDYTLLAGIHTHGYAAFGDILQDKRFSMLLLGLAERVMSPERADLLAERVSNSDLAEEMRAMYVFSPEVLSFLTDRLRMLEHALMVEQALAAVVLAVQGQTHADKSPDPPESVVRENERLLVKFSDCLSKMGPIKRMKVPDNPKTTSLVRRAVFDLHLLLEDVYADMPGLPAVLVCDGVDYAQPRFFADESESPQKEKEETQQHEQPPPPSAAEPLSPSPLASTLHPSTLIQPVVTVQPRTSPKVVEVILDSE